MLNVLELSQAGMEAELETRSPCMTRLDAQKRLDALAAGVRANEVPTETHVQNGVPWECILASVASYHADMLVLGVHGIHRGLSHLLIGSNTERILMSATCPTLTVGAHALAGVELGFHPKEILYYSDLSPAAAAAAPYALWFGGYPPCHDEPRRNDCLRPQDPNDFRSPCSYQLRLPLTGVRKLSRSYNSRPVAGMFRAQRGRSGCRHSVSVSVFATG
jgi:universal stress protein family protein